LVTSERRTGELLFARFPELRFAGYIGATGTGKLAANWIIPSESFDAFKAFAEEVECDNYELAVYTDGKSVIGGGSCEVRVV
jgi:hypothetical protein